MNTQKRRHQTKPTFLTPAGRTVVMDHATDDYCGTCGTNRTKDGYLGTCRACSAEAKSELSMRKKGLVEEPPDLRTDSARAIHKPRRGKKRKKDGTMGLELP